MIFNTQTEARASIDIYKSTRQIAYFFVKVLHTWDMFLYPVMWSKKSGRKGINSA